MMFSAESPTCENDGAFLLCSLDNVPQIIPGCRVQSGARFIHVDHLINHNQNQAGYWMLNYFQDPFYGRE
jgi:hypothetical protein